MKKALPVYCCCDASKFLGTITIDEENIRPGTISFLLSERFACNPMRQASDAMEAPTYVNLEIAKHTSGRRSQIAIKSMHHPIETLRLIPSFKEFP
jgi:hypothetical protein